MTTSSTWKTSSRRAAAAAWLACGLCLAASPAEAAGATAEQVSTARTQMEETIVEVVAVLQNGESSLEKRGRLVEIAQQRFDFRTMSRLVLRNQWKRLSAPKQNEFVTEFTDYLANDYGRRLERYENEEVEVTGAGPKGTRGDVVVETVIRGGAHDGAVVDYRMKHGSDGWRITNVVVEGISLVHNFADQFREVISKDGPEALLQQLREKNAAAAAERSA